MQINWGSGKAELWDGPDGFAGSIKSGSTRSGYLPKDSEKNTAGTLKDLPEALCRGGTALRAAAVGGDHDVDCLRE